MIHLDMGNVLLKPSHRRQMMVWLRRAMKFGNRLGNFVLNLRLTRVGRHFQAHAQVRASAGAFTCHSRRGDWRDAIQQLARTLVARLHAQWVLRSALVT